MAMSHSMGESISPLPVKKPNWSRKAFCPCSFSSKYISVTSVPQGVLTSLGTDRKLDVAAEKLRLRCSFTGTEPDVQICVTLKECCEKCDYGLCFINYVHHGE